MINNDSDDELNGIKETTSVSFFSRNHKIPAIVTTIPCCDKNIKGNTLIKIVHDFVQEWTNNALDYACEPERDNGGLAMIPPPKTVDLSLSIREPREWFMSLGGWKGMMPAQEVLGYFFFQFDSSRDEKKFDSVKIFDNGVIFPIKDHRIHVPDGFSIDDFNVTPYWKKSKNDWVKDTGKTDLSYNQILDAIEHIKQSYSVNDLQIAQLQLWGVNRCTPQPDWISKLTPQQQSQVIIFLDYLNALMFGVEASGLNAALLISTMTLDLLADGLYSYQDAFKANDDGGIYPYACFGNNKGTYSEREKIMLLDPPSMRILRDNPSRSPVAIKEAIIIKAWLKHAGVLDSKFTYNEQQKQIHKAIDDLCTFYFSPWLKHCYAIEKFKACPSRNHTDDSFIKNKSINNMV